MQKRRKFIKQISVGALGIGILPVFVSCGEKEKKPDTSLLNSPDLPRSTPEEQGVLSDAISKFIESIEISKIEFHSFMIVRGGHVIAEGWWKPYAAKYKQQLYSISKSFTSTAIGFAVDEGLLTLDDKVISFFPDDLPEELSDNLKALKVEHLLTMSVGHEEDSMQAIEATDNWAKAFLNIPIVHEPGTKFLYNSGASYMLSAIINKVTGMSAHNYLKPLLFEPLDIVDSTWTENSQGVNIGASHLRLKTEDVAKFGQLYLQEGKWKNKQLLSKKWIKEATGNQIETGKEDNDWAYGYGYQFWMNPPGGFRAAGAYGQYCMVFPEKETVVVITGEVFDKPTAMNLVWNKLLPEMRSTDPIPQNKTQFNKLQHKLKNLIIEPPHMAKNFPIAKLISRKEFLLDENHLNLKSVTFDFFDGKCFFTLKEEGKEDLTIACGINKWYIGNNKKPGPRTLLSDLRIDFESVVAASATWKYENTLLITFRFPESTHSDTITCTFVGQKITLSFLSSIAASGTEGSDSRKEITGSSII